MHYPSGGALRSLVGLFSYIVRDYCGNRKRLDRSLFNPSLLLVKALNATKNVKHTTYIDTLHLQQAVSTHLNPLRFSLLNKDASCLPLATEGELARCGGPSAARAKTRSQARLALPGR